MKTYHSQCKKDAKYMYIILAVDSFPILSVYLLLNQDIKFVRCLHVAITVIGL